MILQERASSSTRLQFLLHVYTLAAFAIAQPIYDMLGRQPEFLVAHKSQPSDILVTTLLISAILPILFALPGLLFGLFVQRLIVTILAAALFTQIINTSGLAPDPIIFWGTVFPATALFWYGYAKITPRLFLSWASLAALVFPLLFLFASPVKKLVIPPNPVIDLGVADTDTPVVVLVFDELPLVSLLDRNGDIDRNRYPHFHALSEKSLWFPNTTTVAEHTLDAIPALLTGRYPDRKRLPDFVDHPVNLFTALSGSHDLGNVNELMTSLCPASLCWHYKALGLSFSARITYLLADLGVVYLHLILPHEYRHLLPAINNTWGGFITPPPRSAVPREAAPNPLPESHPLRGLRGSIPNWFVSFLDRLDASVKPGLHFIHVMLPHYPWRYLPDGRGYVANPKSVPGLNGDNSWVDSPGSTYTAQQRHLLQVGLVDTMVGAVVARMVATGLYDKSLLVVTADHGASFLPGSPRRNLSQDNASEILYVPLFVKPPYLKKGLKNLEQSEIVDVFPTVADVLGLKLDEPLDGISLLGPTRHREKKTVFTQANYQRLEFPVTDMPLESALKRNVEIFGDGQDVFGLFRRGPLGGLIGKEVSSFEVTESIKFTASVDQADLFSDVDDTENFVPAQITGQVHVPELEIESPAAVIVINGIIGASALLSSSDGAVVHRFSAMLPPSLIREGRNELRVFIAASETSDKPHLYTSSQERSQIFRLNDSSNPSAILDEDGRKWLIGEGQSEAHIQRIVYDPTIPMLSAWGWALRPLKRDIAAQYVLFVDGKFRALTTSGQDVEALEAVFGGDHFRRAGFVVRRGSDDIIAPLSKVSIYALFDDGNAALCKLPKHWYSKNPDYLNRRYVYEQQLPRHTQIVSSSIQLDEGGRAIVDTQSGKSYEINSFTLRGQMGNVLQENSDTILLGWAIDTGAGKPADSIVIFRDGDAWHISPVWRARDDVASFFRKESMLNSGFMFRFSSADAEQLSGRSVRVFALAEAGYATELVYPGDYPWGRN